MNIKHTVGLALLAMTLTVNPAFAKPVNHTAKTPIAQSERASYINPKQVQMLFIDLQPVLANNSHTQTPEQLDKSATALAKTAEILNIPTTFALVTQQDGNYQQLPELNSYAKADSSFHRLTVSPFGDEKLVRHLKNNQRPILIIAGFTADGGVLHATLDALGRGYTVYVVADAVGAFTARDEQIGLEQMRQAGAIITSGVSMVTRLAPDLAKADGQKVIQVLPNFR